MSALTVLQFGPVEIVEVLIRGLGTAGVYVMIASGLSLIFGLMGVLNFAHGALTTYGAYLGAGLLALVATQSPTGLGAYLPLLVVGAVVFVALSVAGAGIEYGLVRRLYDRPPLDQILLTFGIALVLEALLEVILDLWEIQPFQPWTAPRAYGPPLVKSGFNVVVGPVEVLGLKIFEFVVGAVVVVLVWLFLTRTRYGLYIRAGSEDDEMAEALGIDVRRVFTFVFGIGIGLAGLAGLFLVWEPTFSLTVGLGAQALLPAFIVVVVGGLGTFKGTVVASAVAGLFAEFGNALFVNEVTVLGFDFGGLSALPQMLLFILLVAMLVIRPTGLYGEEEVGGH